MGNRKVQNRFKIASRCKSRENNKKKQMLVPAYLVSQYTSNIAFIIFLSVAVFRQEPHTIQNRRNITRGPKNNRRMSNEYFVLLVERNVKSCQQVKVLKIEDKFRGFDKGRM